MVGEETKAMDYWTPYDKRLFSCAAHGGDKADEGLCLVSGGVSMKGL